MNHKEVFMKNILILLVSMLALSTASMAATTETKNTETKNNDYFVSSNTNNLQSKMFVLPATNITVLNYSDTSIYVIIPGTSIDYEITSGNSRTISRLGYYGDTRLLIENWFHYNILDRYICNRSIVTVDSSHITIDRKYCI
jgi:hypothetical protein